MTSKFCSAPSAWYSPAVEHCRPLQPTVWVNAANSQSFSRSTGRKKTTESQRTQRKRASQTTGWPGLLSPGGAAARGLSCDCSSHVPSKVESDRRTEFEPKWEATRETSYGCAIRTGSTGPSLSFQQWVALPGLSSSASRDCGYTAEQVCNGTQASCSSSKRRGGLWGLRR